MRILQLMHETSGESSSFVFIKENQRKVSFNVLAIIILFTINYLKIGPHCVHVSSAELYCIARSVTVAH